jgi:type II secretory pathway pseudopilin PulG
VKATLRPLRPHRPSRQRWFARSRACGAFLFEALVAILVFSIGAAGLFALLGTALRESGNAHWRSEAFNVAATTLSQMAAEDPATLGDRYDARTSGPGFRQLLASAVRLPGVTASTNAPLVSIGTGPSGGSRRVAVTVFWQSQTDSSPRRQSVTGAVSQP